MNVIKLKLFGAPRMHAYMHTYRGYKCGRVPVCKLHGFCLPPLSAHDSRHRLLSNEYVPVAWVPRGAYE